jgi:hypothetical protein
MFLRDINTETWPSRLGESWDSKIWTYVPQVSDRRMTVLVRNSSNCKWQTCPHVREGAPHQHTHNCLAVTKIWSLAPDGGFTPRQTGQLTVGRNITELQLVTKLLVFSCCELWLLKVGVCGPGEFWEPRGRGMPATESCYQARAVKKWLWTLVCVCVCVCVCVRAHVRACVTVNCKV